MTFNISMDDCVSSASHFRDAWLRIITKTDATHEIHGLTPKEQIEGRVKEVFESAVYAVLFAGLAAFCIHVGCSGVMHGPANLSTYIFPPAFLALGGLCSLASVSLVKECALQSVALAKEKRELTKSNS